MWKLRVGGSVVLHGIESVNARTCTQWNMAEFSNLYHPIKPFVHSTNNPALPFWIFFLALFVEVPR